MSVAIDHTTASLTQLVKGLISIGWTDRSGYDPASGQAVLDSPKLAGHQWSEAYDFELGAGGYVGYRGALGEGSANAAGAKFLNYGYADSLSNVLSQYAAQYPNNTIAGLDAALATLYPGSTDNSDKTDNTKGDSTTTDNISSKSGALIDKAKAFVAANKTAVEVGGLAVVAGGGCLLYLSHKKKEAGNSSENGMVL